MEIKFQLPNPDDYTTAMEQWFTQMRISLKAAEKTYQEMVKGLTEEETENICIDIGVPFERQAELLKTDMDSDDNPREFIHNNLFIRVWSV